MTKKIAPCADCGTETLSLKPGVPIEYYMVRGEVWQAARAPKRGYLCIGCLETRLGHGLRRGDFSPAAINDLNYGWPHSDRLRDRLTTSSPTGKAGK
jgi:hypothetical protein